MKIEIEICCKYVAKLVLLKERDFNDRERLQAYIFLWPSNSVE